MVLACRAKSNCIVKTTLQFDPGRYLPCRRPVKWWTDNICENMHAKCGASVLNIPSTHSGPHLMKKSVFGIEERRNETLYPYQRI